MSVALTLAKAKAREIMEQYAHWQADQDEPPSLRDGIPHPGTAAVELARYVLGIPGTDEPVQTRRCPQIEPHPAHLWVQGHTVHTPRTYRCNGLDEDTSGE